MVRWLRECNPRALPRSTSRACSTCRSTACAACRACGARSAFEYERTSEGILQLLRTAEEVDAVANHLPVLAGGGHPAPARRPPRLHHARTGAGVRARTVRRRPAPAGRRDRRLLHLHPVARRARLRARRALPLRDRRRRACASKAATWPRVETSRRAAARRPYVVALGHGAVRLLAPRGHPAADPAGEGLLGHAADHRASTTRRARR